jgi:hypothetical protein
MSPQMDLDGNQKMDWFFNEYVYGIELPTYHFEGEVTPEGDANSLHFKLVQSGVSDAFKMMVPIYLDLEDGTSFSIGAINISGNQTIDQTVKLPKFQSRVKRVVINKNYDVLAIDN